MDLIATDYIWRDQKVITECSYDLAYGTDENDFKLVVSDKIPELVGGSLLYIDGTEYGGTIDKIGYNDSQGTITYEGRSWSGILDSKIILPDPSTTFTGYAIEEGTLFEEAITDLLEHMNVLTEDTSERVTADGTAITYNWTFLLDIDNRVKNIPVVNNYVDPQDDNASNDDPNQQYETKYLFEEFVTGYKGICDFLKSINIALTFYVRYVSVSGFKIAVPVLNFLPAKDYTEEEEFDKETLPIDGTHLLNKVNHLIGLGNRVDNTQTRVNVHVYLTANGDLTTDKTQWGFPGAGEIARVEEFGNVMSDACAREAMKKMKELVEDDDFKLTLYAQHSYLIGDTVGRKDDLLFNGDWIKQQITKKIAKLNGQDLTVEYEVGGGIK